MGAGLYSPRAIAIVRAFICSRDAMGMLQMLQASPYAQYQKAMQAMQLAQRDYMARGVVRRWSTLPKWAKAVTRARHYGEIQSASAHRMPMGALTATSWCLLGLSACNPPLIMFIKQARAHRCHRRLGDFVVRSPTTIPSIPVEVRRIEPKVLPP